jgi:hypothetical protein
MNGNFSQKTMWFSNTHKMNLKNIDNILVVWYNKSIIQI